MTVRVGTSGWSYPSWRPDFYPAGADASTFLGFYAERFRTVELNTTGYRLPAEDQFGRWAAQVPQGFEFAPKLPGHQLRTLGVFAERVRALGDRLGPVRVSLKNARDEGVLALMLGSLDPSLRLAFETYCQVVQRFSRHIRLLYREIESLPKHARDPILASVQSLIEIFRGLIEGGMVYGRLLVNAESLRRWKAEHIEQSPEPLPAA